MDEGQPLGPGEFITLDSSNLGDHAQEMVNIGWLLDVAAVQAAAQAEAAAVETATVGATTTEEVTT